MCHEATLPERLLERGIHASIVAHLVSLDGWYRGHAEALDILVDTGEASPSDGANSIAELLPP